MQFPWYLNQTHPLAWLPRPGAESDVIPLPRGAVASWLVILGLMGPGVSATWGGSPLTEDEVAPDAKAAIIEKGIRAYNPATYTKDDLARMRHDADAGQDIYFRFGNQEFSVSLVRSLFFEDSALELQEGIYPYTGVVVQVAESKVRLTIDLARERLDGVVERDHERFYVEPVFDRGPSHVWYRSEDAVIVAQGEGSANDNAGPQPGYNLSQIPGEVNAQVAPPGTYNLNVIRIYYDNENPTAIVNMMDDVYAVQLGIKFYVFSVLFLNTNGYPSPSTCSGTNDFLDRFRVDTPQPTNVDHSQLFSNNGNHNYGNILGCGYQPGTHSWVRFVGSDKQKEIIGAHELGHNFGAPHDDTTTIPHQHCIIFCWWHNHWTIMHGTYAGDGDTEVTFSVDSQNILVPAGNNLPRQAQLWSGSDTTPHNVRLTFWYMHYLKNPTAATIFAIKRTFSAGTGTVTLQNTFFAARNCGNDTCNFDFGHTGPITLDTNPNTRQVSWDPPSGGATWRFWPAYQTQSGQYGPPQWHQLSIYIAP